MSYLNDSICTRWLERHPHPDGLRCPQCQHAERRLFRNEPAPTAVIGGVHQRYLHSYVPTYEAMVHT
jgi:hypothetical protein